MGSKEEFKVIRKNALANPSLYGGRYTQKSFNEAYKAYLNDTNRSLTKVLSILKNV